MWCSGASVLSLWTARYIAYMNLAGRGFHSFIHSLPTYQIISSCFAFLLEFRSPQYTFSKKKCFLQWFDILSSALSHVSSRYPKKTFLSRAISCTGFAGANTAEEWRRGRDEQGVIELEQRAWSQNSSSNLNSAVKVRSTIERMNQVLLIWVLEFAERDEVKDVERRCRARM